MKLDACPFCASVKLDTECDTEIPRVRCPCCDASAPYEVWNSRQVEGWLISIIKRLERQLAK